MLSYILLLLLSGLVVGALARLALPGRDPMGIFATIGIGIAGSMIAGLLTYALFDSRGPGLLLSVLFATLLVYVVRRSRGGTLSRPAPRDRIASPSARRT